MFFVVIVAVLAVALDAAAAGRTVYRCAMTERGWLGGKAEGCVESLK